MDWGKAKNLIILLLALVNAFLVGNLAYAMYTNAAETNRAVAELVAYLDARGIALDESIVPRENAGRTVLVIEQNPAGECSAARVLLRDDSLTTQESGTYTSMGGALNFKIGGYLDGEVYDISSTDNLVELLEEAGIDVGEPTLWEGFVHLPILYGDLPVFQTELVAKRDGSDWTLTGRMCIGRALRAGSGYERDAAGLIIGATEHLMQTGTTQITAIAPGWLAGSVSGVGLRLTPVYRITTDSGVYDLNVVDGTLLNVE